MTTRTGRLVAAIGLGAVLTAVAAGWMIRRGAPPVDAAEIMTARAVALRIRLALADSDRVYLLLEPDRGTLTLWRGAVELRSWPVTEVTAGARRLPIGRGAGRSDWRTALWEGARLDPPVHRERRVIVSDQVAAPDLTGAVDWVPPTPEEEVPSPERFVVHFGDGLGLDVRASGADASAHRPGLRARIRNRMAGLQPSNWDRYRIRVAMASVDAGALYRTLPEGTAFLAVLPGR